MSDENAEQSQGAEVSGFHGGTYDYLDKKEASKPANSKEQAQEPVKEPWRPPENKQKNQTPAWAQARFHELTQEIRTLKAENGRISGSHEALLKGFMPEKSEAKIEQFKKEDGSYDYEAFSKKLLESQLGKAKEDWMKEFTEKQQTASKSKELAEVAASNFEKTKAEIPDLDTYIQAIDPEIVIEQDALEHLQRSPVGFKTLYRIGGDAELQAQLKEMSVQERRNTIAKLHDSILQYEIDKQSNNGGGQPEVPQKPSAPAPRKPIPSPPPKQRGSGEIGAPSLNMSGDEWIKAQNERKKR